jgi:hypothetical protein
MSAENRKMITTLIEEPFECDSYYSQYNILVITHKGGRDFTANMHFGKYNSDVEIWDILVRTPADRMAEAQLEALGRCLPRLGEGIVLQRTDDQSGPTSTPRQRIYKVWFSNPADYEGIGMEYERMPDFTKMRCYSVIEPKH